MSDGMTKEQEADLLRSLREQDRKDRRDALTAIWRPSRAPQRAFREYEWTVTSAIRATIGLLLNRRWTDKAESKFKSRGGDNRHAYGTLLASWDCRKTYGGYAVMCVELRPGCRVGVFDDGECLM